MEPPDKEKNEPRTKFNESIPTRRMADTPNLSRTGMRSFVNTLKRKRKSKLMDDETPDNVVNLTSGKNVPVKGKQGRRFTGERVKGKNRSLTPDTTLLTDEQELFCQYVADSYSYTRAYQLAYKCAPSTANTKGSELMKRDYILKRVGEVKRERLISSKMIDPNESLVRWNELYKYCMELGDIKGAMEAQKNIDKINGAANNATSDKDKKGVFSGTNIDEWTALLPNLMEAISLAKKTKEQKDEDPTTLN